jgi:hypothetical protein
MLTFHRTWSRKPWSSSRGWRGSRPVRPDEGIWETRGGAFTQHYDTEVLDSSLLMMPLLL